MCINDCVDKTGARVRNSRAGDDDEWPSDSMQIANRHRKRSECDAISYFKPSSSNMGWMRMNNIAASCTSIVPYICAAGSLLFNWNSLHCNYCTHCAYVHNTIGPYIYAWVCVPIRNCSEDRFNELFHYFRIKNLRLWNEPMRQSIQQMDRCTKEMNICGMFRYGKNGNAMQDCSVWCWSAVHLWEWYFRIEAIFPFCSLRCLISFFLIRLEIVRALGRQFNASETILAFQMWTLKLFNGNLAAFT